MSNMACNVQDTDNKTFALNLEDKFITVLLIFTLIQEAAKIP